ncbi:BZ3500_MvSof-1268-A1-R1_Chr3-1g05779 [Microbotryum saponariae]|uniref:BZ3500_MvSof-1268-A1-R1_Chr3-1g05779 protein n=1 Tax=Microbotryum saponariae TaxID=289078 RepID=A0A2X0LGI4_9BASI|nr:BZ3500_MvSof-1268-A1-R1_Chr3-1g05779 [Microbotryum saponariae]SDA04969.1 BZ3501_MvSof-1269-A2-R1_Chr3-1g05449 [Microbotryum saponariae]
MITADLLDSNSSPLPRCLLLLLLLRSRSIVLAGRCGAGIVIVVIVVGQGFVLDVRVVGAGLPVFVVFRVLSVLWWDPRYPAAKAGPHPTVPTPPRPDHTQSQTRHGTHITNQETQTRSRIPIIIRILIRIVIVRIIVLVFIGFDDWGRFLGRRGGGFRARGRGFDFGL